MFEDRIDAGQKLAEHLRIYSGDDSVIFAIPRGGVVIGAEVCRVLACRLDIIVPRKIGAPKNPELAIGAVAGEGDVILNDELVRNLKVRESYIEEAVSQAVAEIKRREEAYRKRPPADVTDKTAIIVDDGLATGYTALAAIKALRRRNPKQLVLAVPVAPHDSFNRAKEEVDDAVCLSLPAGFLAVAQFYRDFSQVTDKEVVSILSNERGG